MKTIHPVIGKAILFCFGILMSTNSSALVSTYNFSQSNSAFVAIAGGTVLGDTANNSNTFNANNIGFTFYYNGQAYTQFGVSVNGYITFSTLGFTSTTVTVISSGGAVVNNVISALNCDLQGQPGSVLQYLTTGVAPNRVLVVQWSGYRANGATGDNINFQIRLSESNNSIDVKYGTCVSTTRRNTQIGLKGASNADYNNRHVDSLITWATSAPGATNNDTCTIKTGFAPASGQTYSWSSTAPAVPITMTFTNITATGMTVNWIDNSTNDSLFAVYKSTDGVNFTFAGNVVSTTRATTGTQYSMSFPGLSFATQYWYRVYSVDLIPSTTFLAGNAFTLAGTLCGVLKIGPAQTYLTIRSAIRALQTNGMACSVVLELKTNYVSSVDTFPIVVPYLFCNAGRTLTLRPEAGSVNLKLDGDTTQIIDLDGATYFTIDGRAGGTGTAINLTLIDSSATGNCIRFINDSKKNTLTYLGFKGAGSGANGNAVIYFGTGASAGGGNDSNTISNCDITKSSLSPQVLLYSSANNGSNKSNTVTNCLFHDWFFNGASNYGINLAVSNSAWTITNNSFYQTTAQTYTSGNTHGAINIAGGGGGSPGITYTISGNTIGGSASNGTGTWTMNGTGGTRFNGISLSAGDTTTTSSIQGNTIKNISMATSAGGGGNATIFNGIAITGGNVNVGNTTPNIIGSITANNSIVTIASQNGMQTNGISCSSTGTVNIQGNTIGGIFANDSIPGINTSVIGVTVSAGTIGVRNNIIGSSSQANSISNGPGSAAGNSLVIGISINGNVNSSQVTGNLIRNLTNQYTGTSNTGVTRGISATAGSNFISANLIENLSNTAPQNGTGSGSTVLGISQVSTDSLQSVTVNIIRLLSNKSNQGNVSVVGIYYNGPTVGANVIEKNRIYGIGASLDTSIAVINGIQVNAGNVVVDNNMISIGTDTLGGTYTQAHEYNGLLKSGGGNTRFYFNSVNVAGGNVVNRAVNSFAFRRTSAGTDTLRNNIFANFRSNATTGGSHYAISLNNSTGVTSGKNDLFGNGSGYKTGLFNGVDQNSLFAWFSASTVDSNSLATNPNFLSVTNLHINTASPISLESGGYTLPGFATDYDNQVRPGPTGSIHGGMSAPDIGADEFDGFPLVGIDMGPYALVKPGVGCHSASDSVKVSIKNYSSSSINFVASPCSLYVSVTGTNPMVFPPVYVNTGSLASGATQVVTIANAYNMSVAGSYVFHAYTVTAADVQLSNDTIPAVTITISAGVTSPGTSNICSGSQVTLILTGQTPGSTIQWQSSPNGSAWTNVPAASNDTLIITPVASTYYKAVTCNVYSSNVDTVTLQTVAAPIPTGDTRCGIGSVTVSATGANPILWFDSLTGPNMLDTGSTFTTIVTGSRNFYAAANGNLSTPKSQTTALNGGSASGGIMFEITALNNINITSLDCRSDSGVSTWGIYFRRDNIVNVPGANTDSIGWLFVDTVSNVLSTTNTIPTLIPIAMNILIPAGQTYSFYIVKYSGPNLNYTNTTPGTPGNVYSSNADLQIRDGYSHNMLNQPFNATSNPRAFNGVVHYKTSCISNRVAAAVVVTPPTSINAVANNSAICSGDSIHLTVSSANANYDYQWTPTNTLSDTIGTSVWAYPTSNTVYFVTAYDSSSTCSTLDSVEIRAYSGPAANVSISIDSICQGDTVILQASVSLNHFIGSGGNSNGATTYPAPYGNNNYGARHQMLVRADEMAAAGLVPGYLAAITFNVQNLNNVDTLNNFTIKAGTTNVTDLTATFQTSPLTTVYTNAGYIVTNGINQHDFTTPIYWNGSTNILIECCFNNTTSSANAGTRMNPTSFNSCTYYHADTAINCAIPTGTVVAQRPNMRFIIRNQYTSHWTSTEPINNPNADSTYSVPLASADYIVTVTDTVNGCQTTDTVSVAVDLPPIVNLGIDTAVCGSYLLNAGNPGDDYQWQDGSNNQTYLADTTGIYGVTVTHLQSCSSSDSISITVNALPSVSLALPWDSLCSNLSGIQVLSGGTPAGGIYSGTGVTGTSFDPASPGVGYNLLGYTYIDGATGCLNTVTDSVYIDICANVKELGKESLISIYPNPVSKELSIDMRKINETCKVELMTPETKVIGKWNIHGGILYPLNLTQYSNGIYYLKISGENINYVVRIVKQN